MLAVWLERRGLTFGRPAALFVHAELDSAGGNME
jgi:hypothetical protein